MHRRASRWKISSPHAPVLAHSVCTAVSLHLTQAGAPLSGRRLARACDAQASERRPKGRTFILLCKPSWLARNEHFINEADNNCSMASSTKLIMAAGSLPAHGPMPSTEVSYIAHVYHPRLNPPATHRSTVHDRAKVLVSPAIDPPSTIVPRS